MQETERHLKGPAKVYRYTNPEKAKAPAFDRVISLLSDQELADEILAGRGAPDYQAALAAAQARREARS